MPSTEEPEAIQRRLESLSRAVRSRLWGKVRRHFRLLAITRYWLKLSDEWRRFKALYVDTKRNPEKTEKEWGWLRRWGAGRPWPWLPAGKEWFVRMYWETLNSNRLLKNEWTTWDDLENAQLEFKYDLLKELENAARGSLLGRFENYVRHSETCAEWHKREWQDELWRRRRTAAYLGPSVGHTVDPDVSAKCTQLRWELVRRHVRLRAIVRYWKKIRPLYVRYCSINATLYWAGPCYRYGPSWVVEPERFRLMNGGNSPRLLHELVNNGDFLAPKGWEVVRRHVRRRALKAKADRQAAREAARVEADLAAARAWLARAEAASVEADLAAARANPWEGEPQARRREAADSAWLASCAVTRAETDRRRLVAARIYALRE